MPNDFNTLVAKITNQVTDEERLLHEYLCTSLGDDYLEHYTVVEVDEVDYFEHHGVKGMKWGIRKKRDGFVDGRKTTMNRRDKKSGNLNQRILNLAPNTNKAGSRAFKRQEKSNVVAHKVYDKTLRAASRPIKKEIKTLNLKYKGKDLSKPSKERDKYYSEITLAVNRQLQAASHLKSKGGLRMDFKFDAKTSSYPTANIVTAERGQNKKAAVDAAKQTRSSAKNNLRTEKERVKNSVSHEDTTESSYTRKVNLEWDSDGLLVDIDFDIPDDSELAHEFVMQAVSGIDFELIDISEFALEHYGVKGMKWGLRKRSKTRVSSSGARSTSPNPSSKVSAPNPSSKVSAPTTRDKRVKALKNRRELSDSDIKDFTSRLQSEKQLKALLDEDVSPGRTFIKKVMSDAGKQAATKLATNAMTYGTTKVMGKAFGSELEKALSGKKKD